MTSTQNQIDIFDRYRSLIALANIFLPPGMPNINKQTLQYVAATGKWIYVPATGGAGFVTTTTNQTINDVKTFTSVINANAGINMPAATNLTVNTPSTPGYPEIDILQTALDVPLSLTYGVRIRRPDNLAFSQFAWDANGFSLYRVDAGVPSSIFTVANGRLTMLQDPAGLQDAATKNYADKTQKKELAGYIPPLFSGSSATINSLKTGFVASASSIASIFWVASNAFNSLYATGSFGEWATGGTNVGSWLQVSCPDQVRIWQIALRGRDSNTQRMLSWTLTASNDNFATSTTLLSSSATLGSTVQVFAVSTTVTQLFSYYRITCVTAEGGATGLSYFQIFVYSPST